jgi:hypothetical protein
MDRRAFIKASAATLALAPVAALAIRPARPRGTRYTMREFRIAAPEQPLLASELYMRRQWIDPNTHELRCEWFTREQVMERYPYMLHD